MDLLQLVHYSRYFKCFDTIKSVAFIAIIIQFTNSLFANLIQFEKPLWLILNLSK